MSRSTTRSRISLLASSSFAALAGMGALATASLLPSTAMAVCPDDPALAGTDFCSGVDASGVTYTLTGDSNIVVSEATLSNAGTAMTVNAGAFDTNIFFEKVGGPGSTINGTAGNGIAVTSTGGDVSIDTFDSILFGPGAGPSNQPTGISGTTSGINISNTTGKTDISIAATDTVTGGSNDGIHATSTTGAINVAITGTASGTTSSAVELTATGSGNVKVDLAASSTTTSNAASFAIAASAGSGTATVNSAGAITEGGIFVNGGTGTGNVNITGGNVKGTIGPIVSVNGATANFNLSGGSVKLTAGASSAVQLTGGATSTAKIDGAAGTTITSTGQGVGISSGTVTGTFNSDVTAGGAGDGLHIVAGAGGVNLVTGGVIKGGATGDGIDITSTGGIQLTTNGAVFGDPSVILADNSAAGILYNANANNTGATVGISAIEAFAGSPVTINVANGVLVTSGAGVGILAQNSNVGGTPVVTVNLLGSASVSATGGDGVKAQIDGAAGSANINTGSGTVSAQGVGVIGLFADADGGGGFTGDAKITTGDGFTVNAGTVGANGANFGIAAESNDSANAQVSQVTLGNNNTINVGSAAGVTEVGIFVGHNTTANAATLKAGSGLAVNVAGDFGFGLELLNAGDTINATLTSGAITVTDTVANQNSFGVFSQNTTGATTIDLGTTTVTNTDGIGIQSTATTGAITVTAGGLVKATSTGINVSNTGAGTLTVNANGITAGSGVKADAIDVVSTGAANINIKSDGASVSSGNGFVATTVGGNIDIDNNSTVTVNVGPAPQVGIIATTSLGGNIKVDSSGAISAPDGGINATTDTGAITIAASAKIDGDTAGGGGGFGIKAAVTTGTINIATTAAGDITVKNGGGPGIDATATGGVAGDQIVIAADGDAIVTGAGPGINASIAAGAGNIVVTGAGAFSSTTGNGVLLANNGSGSTTTKLTGSATGGGLDGVNIVNKGGTIDATTNVATGKNNGIFVRNDAVNGAGAITVTANGNVTGTLLNGIDALTSASGAPVTVNVATGVLVKANNTGISAINTNTGGAPVVTVNLLGTASVTATNGHGVLAQIDGTIGSANINLGSGTVSTSATGGVGLFALADGGGGFTGDAKITTGNGATVQAGPSNAIGIFASTNDSAGAQVAQITLGNNNTITVGSVAGTKNLGVVATGLIGNAVTVLGGSGLNLTVNGDASIGLLTDVSGDSETVKLTSGSITVNDTVFDGDSVGVLATNTTGTTSIDLGTTTVANNDGVGVKATSSTGAITVTAGGQVTAAGTGINVSNTGSGALTVDANGVTATGAFAGQSDAIKVISTGKANITVKSDGPTVSDGNGIVTTTLGGNIDIDNNSTVTVNVGLPVQQGIIATTSLGGNIKVDSSGAISAPDGGINATTDTGAITIAASAKIDGDTAGGGGGFGIKAAVTTGTINIATTAAGDITVKNGGGPGIDATATGGVAGDQIVIAADGDAIVTGAGPGINASIAAGAGNIVVTGAGAFSSTTGNGVLLANNGSGSTTTKLTGSATGGGLDGVNIINKGGAIDATTNVATGKNNGIFVRNDAVNGAGAITVTANGNVTGTLLNGIDALTSAADAPVTVNVATGVLVKANNTGISAINSAVTGNNVATVNLLGTASVTATNGHGVLARIDGTIGSANINLGSGTVTTSANGAVGLFALADGGGGFTGDAKITTGDGATVLAGASNAIGVFASTNDSAGAQVAQVTLGKNNTITVGGVAGTKNFGVVATGNLGNAVTVLGGSGLNLTVNGDASAGLLTDVSGDSETIKLTSGSITVNDTVIDGDSVGVLATNTTGTTSIDLGTTSVTNTDGDGVRAVATSSGAITVTSGGLIKATEDGIDVKTGGTISVTSNGSISAPTGHAIITNAGGNQDVTIGAGATVTGSGVAVTGAVIDLTTVAGATTKLTNNGTITSKQAAPAANGDLAVLVTNGSLTFNNNGTLRGRIDASKTTSVTMTNTGFTSWHTTGTSTFSPGADTLTNTGLIATNAGGAATTLDFGLGADVFNNNAGGVLVAGEAPQAASNLVLTGLETLTNNGRIVFGSNSTANPFLSDRVANDKINAAGTAFGGSGVLAMDADLSFITQTSCVTLTAADCLAVGTTSGTNSIQVSDTGAHAAGSFNPGGIVLVTGVSSATSFKLDPTSDFYSTRFGGILDKPGLFFYDLAFNAGTALLVGVPDTEAFELTEMGAQAQDVWYASTQTWFDRQADLRVTLAGRAEGWAPAVWLKVMGQWTDRDNTATFSLLGKSYAFDVGYRQDTTGVIGGVDVLRGSNGTEGYAFGVQGGYMDSDVRYHSVSRAKLSGPTFGVYGTYMNGGFFLDGIVNANFMNLDVDMPNLAPPPTPFSTSADVRSYGGQLETGYQMALGSNGFWEPIASLSYVHTDIHDLSLGSSGSVSFPTTTSFRGSLGLRLGMTGDFQYYRVRATLTGRYIDEFDGTNDIVIVSPGPSNLALSDGLNGGFGEVGVGTNVFATGGHLSAFANANVRFQSDYQSTSVTAGFRYQW